MAADTANKKKTRNRILLVLEIICIIIAVVCGFLFFREVSTYVEDDNDFKAVVERTHRDISTLRAANSDCIGWIESADTRIDYPVMYTPEDPEYYLHRNFEKEDSRAGTPFMGVNSDPSGNSRIVYGHHMRDGSMFADLEKYNESGWGKDHAFVYTDEAGEHTFLPIGCFYVDLTRSDYYRYWDNVGQLSQQQFEDYVSNVKSMSLYDTGRTAAYGDKIMTLSTCSYGTSEQRFVVVGVEVK